MKHFLTALFLLVLMATLPAQSVTVKCYSYQTFTSQDCPGCGLKSGLFAGLILQNSRGTRFALHNPVSYRTIGSNTIFIDAFGQTISFPKSSLPNDIDNIVKSCLSYAQTIKGGTEDQVLAKNSDKDYDLKWMTVDTSSGGGAGVTDGDKGDIVVSDTAAIWTIDDNAVGSSKIAGLSIVTAKIADQNVTNAKLALGSVTATTLAPNAVETAKIANGAVTAVKLASNAVATASIADGSVTQAKLDANAVDAINILPNAVVTAKISDQNVTDAKLSITGVSAGTYNRVQVNTKGRVSAAYMKGDTIPAGGTTGQVLAKSSGTNYATTWTTPNRSLWYILPTIADTSTITGAATISDKLLIVATGFIYNRLSGYWNYDGSLKGATGATGTAGAAGSVWRNGVGAPSDALGVNGDYYLNETDGAVSLKSGGVYIGAGNIKGATGATGAAGATGATGQGFSDGDKGDITIGSSGTTLTIDASAVNSSKIADATIVTADISTGGVATGNILDGTILTGDISTGGVTSTNILDGTIANADIANTTIAVGKINATGTPSSTTYLRGDGTWNTPSGGGGGVTVTKYRVTSTSTTPAAWTPTLTSGKKYKLEIYGQWQTSSTAAARLGIAISGAGAGADINGFLDANTNTNTTQSVFIDNQNIDFLEVECGVNATAANTPYAFKMNIYLEGQSTGTLTILLGNNGFGQGTVSYIAGTTLVVYEY